MKDLRNTGIPEFKSIEEEKEYWESQGPLSDGHEGRINKPGPKQKRSSFLAVRLTGEELTRLRDMAEEKGLGPSTYARILLTTAIERQSKPQADTLSEIKSMVEDLLAQSRAAGEKGN